jgi:hypothetical protein
MEMILRRRGESGEKFRESFDTFRARLSEGEPIEKFSACKQRDKLFYVGALIMEQLSTLVSLIHFARQQQPLAVVISRPHTS